MFVGPHKGPGAVSPKGAAGIAKAPKTQEVSGFGSIISGADHPMQCPRFGGGFSFLTGFDALRLVANGAVLLLRNYRLEKAR
jgi:hypothetical protein